VWYFSGADFATQYFAGWLTEYSLSVDNLFVFLIIMAKFGVPEKLQQSALMVGIVIALILRGIFIAVGAAAINRFSWIFYIFGAFLIYTAVHLALEGRSDDDEFEENRFLKWVETRFPATNVWHGTKLFIRSNGSRIITPMFIVILALGTTDLLFALDSIPAIYGLTQEPFLVLTANIFALMGLRQLYFLIGGLLKRLVYLGVGLAILLAFIGTKLILHALHVNELPFINGGSRSAALRRSRSVSRWRSSSGSWPSRPSRACSRAARTTRRPPTATRSRQARGGDPCFGGLWFGGPWFGGHWFEDDWFGHHWFVVSATASGAGGTDRAPITSPLAATTHAIPSS